ncbi:MAG TPA: DNA replication/repair protein RecF [Aggregatilinea sp.]|uniref:DNA replication/repair protein RecF n=1 Tax=Aggregatilinea sp. TaxID=2806333 RepID=UPI002C9E1D70|nr:DNA replication/repair protein RecF [Aggregatilinea sp.]HML23084.1 DNA replication/repair protein RecF [Aggregatilinea sp.]
MRIEHLSLQNFRNYARLEVTLPPGPILLHGANAQGKTSLLEAIYYLATSRSPYTSSDRQLINWYAERDILPFARIAAEITSARESLNRVEVVISLDQNGGTDSDRFRKQVKINGVPRRVMDLIGQINVVMFLPQDLSLVEGAPAERRRYMNITLCQTDGEYCRALAMFDKVLTQRNALLKRISDREASPGELGYWNDQIAESGATLVAGRQQLLRQLEVKARRIHDELSGGDEDLELKYLPGFSPTAENNGQLSFEVLGLDLHRQMSPGDIAEQFLARLAEIQGEEIARGMTLIGPQRDELRLMVNGHDLGLYGSRGQARTGVMSLKLAELEWMRDTIGEWPVLLLDEVAAELDSRRRAYLLDRVSEASQVLLTTTEPDIFPSAFLNTATRWEISQGQIISATDPIG